MWLFGLISSLFDALTFWLLLQLLHADAALFRTGWFVESLVSQVLVIFVIRTRGRPWASRPGPALVAAALAVVAIGGLLPATPLAPLLGMQPLPGSVYLGIGVLVLAYLGLVELAKRGFYRWLDKPHRARRRARAGAGR